jgi:Asp-tRNA(Asn)/Glu-tRNA(Gln) amidotransferase A subunit family amidase
VTIGAAGQQLDIAAWQQESRSPESALRRLGERLDRDEPRLHALVPEPGRLARLRQELASTGDGVLAGVPVGIKDIFHVDGLPTRAGTQLPADELGGPQATVVTSLRQAGALILGKTVTTEFAYFAPGPTRNPHNPEHTPGGSSSGSAAAVAAGYCPLALGTQTIGSISRPAAYCGVIGYKPTWRRIDMQGVIPLAPSFDHVGLFAASVEDATTAAATLCRDWTNVPLPPASVLGIPAGPYLERASATSREHLRAVCRALEERGWEIRSVDLWQDFAPIEARHQRILAAEAARVHERWFDQFGHLYHARTRELIERGRSIRDRQLADDLAAVMEFRDWLDRRTEQAGIDLWLSPAATGPAPHGLDSTGDPIMSLPWTQAGLPTCSLPVGRDTVTGLPLGLQVAGRRLRDENLLLVCAELARDLGRWS